MAGVWAGVWGMTKDGRRVGRRVGHIRSSMGRSVGHAKAWFGWGTRVGGGEAWAGLWVKHGQACRTWPRMPRVSEVVKHWQQPGQAWA
eukprot:350229-Chlamydomonas_euryale.AAC.4